MEASRQRERKRVEALEGRRKKRFGRGAIEAITTNKRSRLRAMEALETKPTEAREENERG